MAEKSSLEVKVGVFVFISLIIFAAFVLLIGDFRDLSNRYSIKIIFGFVDGVKVGSPVRFAGFDVGEVKDVDMIDPSLTNNNTQVQVTATLKGHVRVPKDSQVWVNTLGLLGEKYIEIMPGKDYANVLRNQDTIIGRDPVAMHAIFSSVYSVVDDLKKIADKISQGEGTIGKLLYDDKVYTDLEAFVEDIRKYPWKLLYRTKENKPPHEKSNIRTR